MKYQGIREEELKNKIANDYFWLYDSSKIIGNIDFCVCMHQSEKELVEQESLLWAEAKKGASDIYKSIVQLILTIGKARTFDIFLPPALLGAFDCEKMAFIPYSDIHDIFYLNDFNWNVTPSNHDTKEFKLIHKKVKHLIDSNALLFNFIDDDRELIKFIKKNFIVGKFGLTKTKIDKNNFMIIYNKWLQLVKPTIAVKWEAAKSKGIIDGDFYLADLLSQENNTLKEKLFVLLKHDHYELDRKIDEVGMFSSKRTDFTDKQLAHTQFWNKYDRPPKEEYWDYIVARRDLLVPQDVRERKGSFFTPQIWVALSQQYLTNVLGENWQEEYYVWDCAAGTGNLLAGLTNKYNIWASTLDSQDVDVMHDRIKNGANLLNDHVFQFDFLNDDFSKLPKPLQDIINNSKKRKKLVMYINPPYAEAGDTKQRSGHGKNKSNVSNQTLIHRQYSSIIKDCAKRELFIQFFTRIYAEIHGSTLANFSTLKILQAPYFSGYRDYFLSDLKSMFVVPANSFDNVKGSFPIGFFIWNTDIPTRFNNVEADVYNTNGIFEEKKKFYSYDDDKNINDWLRPTWKNAENRLAYLTCNSNDFQNSTGVFIQSNKSNETSTYYKPITPNNLIQSCIYFTVRKCIEATWLNDRDQFLHPNHQWQTDDTFQNDCLAFTLFNNNVQSKYGTNHWIPFTEEEVNAREKFASSFMTDFIKGKPNPPQKSSLRINLLFEPDAAYGNNKPLLFSREATAVFNAGRELWTYYHQQPNCNVHASLYDIREHFQGRNEAGKMNNKSLDETYTNLIRKLREKLKQLAEKIEPKVYKYGFLKQ
ncbi:MAG: hypothetical protein QM528_09130 [Phycisphaerales bacterium]|nr:hypothetical protein [Phycisphaerales bacterium]